jgi:ribosomal protein L7/L12
MSKRITFTWSDDFYEQIEFWSKSTAAKLIGAMDEKGLPRMALVFGLENFARVIANEMKVSLQAIEENLEKHVKEVAQHAYTVLLDGCDAARRIPLIKAVRIITGLSLKEAKDLIDAAPQIVKEKISKDEAEGIKAELEAAGAQVKLVY